ncbi:MAG: 4-alpha-glucanotransferase [Pseudomonadota bacterium]
MSDDVILDRARAAGIAVDWTDAAGRPQRVRPEALRRLVDALDFGEASSAPPPLVTATVGRRVMLPGIAADAAGELALEDGDTRPVKLRNGGLPGIRQAGYHKLRVGDREITLAVAPPRCLTAHDIGGGHRMWGLAVQVYGLRRAGDGGIGDAGSVRDVAEAAARQGADAVALSPVHSLFVHDLGRYGPYAPSSRLFLNPLLADPAATFPDAADGDAGFEQAELIDWPAAGAAKLARLRGLFERFETRRGVVGDALIADFERFVREGGETLRGHAEFETSRSGGPARYHLFLQWITARSFAEAQRAAKAAGMRIGLISDLAIGMDRSGSHAVERRGDLLMDLSIGAPPDLFNPAGQDWGLTGFSPRALVASGFEPFLATLRAALANAGGVRIDHIIGLMRLWLIPRGAAPADGAYLAYPLEDLLRLLALESHRHGAVVIGEDLGTVPAGFRARLRRAGIAGLDVLWFERTRLAFRRPSRWRREAVATTTTHDLPTVAGWWSGEDIRTRLALGLPGAGDEAERARDRLRLWRAFSAVGTADGAAPPPEQPEAAVDAALAYVAQSPSSLMLAPAEDLLGVVPQPNLPGTVDEHPNWRRRIAPLAQDLFDAPQVRRRVELIRRHRVGGGP